MQQFADIQSCIGIGRACARALAKDGAAGLLIADIDTSAAQETAAQCQEVATNRHFRVETTRVDITDEINAEIADSDLFAYQRMLYVNTTGTFLVILQISDLMRGQDPRRLLSPLGDHRGSTRGAIVFEDHPGLEEVITKMHPMGCIATEEVVDAVSFLCSDKSSYMTGCALLIDGWSTLTCHV
ncbi:hypothetical protein BDW60DRAFT_217932 [Aspergillus nidulans var. acristatus]